MIIIYLSVLLSVYLLSVYKYTYNILADSIKNTLWLSVIQ